MENNKMEAPDTGAGTEPRRPFYEPEISDSVEVVKGNPAATTLFAVAGSFVTP